ncbi:MAG: membrane protein insertase YidC [Anaerolineae bacterium]|nr:membrane protein insertase YidC [Anaerolineae bacterium]
MLDIIVNPFITILLFLYQILGGNVVLSIITFTAMVRLATLPLTLRQQRSTKAMQELQPELKRIQEKYKNDRERAAQAQWELYREYGVNPMAGCLTLLIQFPILIGLYRAIVVTLAATPLQLLDLSGRLWVSDLSSQVPLANKFLWLNLAMPDPLYVLPILVVATTYLQQKLLMPPTQPSAPGDKQTDQAAAMTRQMTTIMPIMFGIFALSFASGLSIYFIASNFIGIGQYALLGRIDIKRMLGRGSDESDETETTMPAKTARKTTAKASAISSSVKPAKREPAALAAPAAKPRHKVPPVRDANARVIKPKRSGIHDSRAQPKTKG